MKSKLLISCAIIVVLTVPAIAYNVASSSKTYEFTHATQMNDSAGTVTFYLRNGSTISFQNEFTREDVQASQMLKGGSIVVGYSFIGWPVSVQYLDS